MMGTMRFLKFLNALLKAIIVLVVMLALALVAGFIAQTLNSLTWFVILCVCVLVFFTWGFYQTA